MEILEMSKKERQRLEVLKRLSAGKVSQQMAAKELHLGTRQLRRLQRSYEAAGSKALLSKQRGQPSNHQLAPKLKRLVVDLIRSRYPDFGPTLAHEKLVELHGLHLGLETVRQLMIVNHLWQPRKHRRGATLHPLRDRRPGFGELIQIDGSPHDWFEGRAPRCTLIVFIDDATSRLQQLRLVPAETTFAYFQVLHDYIVAYGKPVALYSDKFGVFRVNQPYLNADSGQTQFGRAAEALNIELICANSPQAKGRVERANQTLQDRLVKELRLHGISDLATANAFLPSFVDAHNAKFAVTPHSTIDAHRPLAAHENLSHILCLHTVRTLSKNLTLQYDRALYQITTATPGYRLRNRQVMVLENAASEVTIKLNADVLAYRVYHRAKKQGVVLSAKEVQAVQWPITEAVAASVATPTQQLGEVDDTTPITIPKKARRKYIPPRDSSWRKMAHAEVELALRRKAKRESATITPR